MLPHSNVKSSHEKAGTRHNYGAGEMVQGVEGSGRWTFVGHCSKWKMTRKLQNPSVRGRYQYPEDEDVPRTSSNETMVVNVNPASERDCV